MHRLLADQALAELYDLPKNYQFTEASKRYYGSLIPKKAYLDDVREINFEVQLSSNANGLELPYENNINPHVFKPRYYPTADVSKLICIVPNHEVLAHSLRSLYVNNYHDKKSDIIINATDHTEEYGNYTKDWVIEDRVIICQIPSFLNFLNNFWLLEQGVPPNIIQKISGEFENRLKTPDKKLLRLLWNELRDTYGIDYKKFNKAYLVHHQESAPNCVAATNISVAGVGITLLQLTWGYKTSFDMLSSVFAINPNIKSIVMIGGIGYLGHEEVAVDDIFMPQNLVRLKNGKAFLEPLNSTRPATSNRYFENKRVAQGNLHTVIPTIGKLSNTALLQGLNPPVDAIDMEVEAFIDVLDNYPNVDRYLINYIMDIPSKGIGLGDTYYDPTFAAQLFKDFNRGKYYCFEQALLRLVGDALYA